MTPRRFRLVTGKLALRQPDLTVLLEGVHKPHNFSAILRSCDAVGVHRAHVVPPSGGLPVASATAQGAQKWVKVERHADMQQAAEQLKQAGFALYAADVGTAAVDFRSLDYTQPSAFVMGTEKHGISESARALCDGLVTIPMQGMVESLNVSVATALLLFEAQRQRLDAGLYQQCRLSATDYRQTLFEWLHPQIARYCRDRKLDYPQLDDEGEVIGTIRGTGGAPF